MDSIVGAKQRGVPLSEKETLKRESWSLWELGGRDFQTWRAHECKSEVEMIIFEE